MQNTKGIKRVYLACGCNEIIFASHLQLNITKNNRAGIKHMSHSNSGQPVKLVQMRSLPYFSGLQIELQVCPATNRDLMTQAPRKRLSGGTTENTVISKNVFEQKIVSVDTCARQNAITNSQVRQCPKDVISLLISVGKKYVCFSALTDFSAGVYPQPTGQTLQKIKGRTWPDKFTLATKTNGRNVGRNNTGRRCYGLSISTANSGKSNA